MRVVLIHGKDTDPSKKWYPWLGEEVRKAGFEFIAPILPHANEPIMAEWLMEINKTNPDKDTILIGHSRGGVAILRWLEKQLIPRNIRRVILIAANGGRKEDKVISSESNNGFYTEKGFDFETIKTGCSDFVVIHSHDDNWVPFSAGEINAAGLKAKFIQLDNYGHFGQATESIPELIPEILR